MKILLITDQHFGVRNDNQHFINHYAKFYGRVVIPFMKASGIKEVIVWVILLIEEDILILCHWTQQRRCGLMS